jgi:arylformamidase
MSWREYAADLEWHFNPQATTAIDFKSEFARRAEMSAAAMARLDHRADVRYGPGPREVLDIFPAGDGKAPIHVHIHGGYFRMGDKRNQTLMVEPFVRAGIPCVLPTYDLCPDVTLDELVNEVLDSIAWVHHNADLIGGDPGRIYLSGPSAGAHLCAMALAHDWTERGLPADFITGAALLTGVYDLEPLLHISLNKQVRLTSDRVTDNSPMRRPPLRPVPLLFEVGGDEPPGWQAQTQEFADVCRAAGCSVEVHVLPGETHFSVSRALARPDHPLTMKMISAIMRS